MGNAVVKPADVEKTASICDGICNTILLEFSFALKSSILDYVKNHEKEVGSAGKSKLRGGGAEKKRNSKKPLRFSLIQFSHHSLAAAPPTLQPIKAGVLLKQGKHVTTWKKRSFTVYNNFGNFEVVYRGLSSETAERGRFFLHDYSVQERCSGDLDFAEDPEALEFFFDLVPLTLHNLDSSTDGMSSLTSSSSSSHAGEEGSGSGRTWHLKALTLDDYKDWLHVFRYAINRTDYNRSTGPTGRPKASIFASLTSQVLPGGAAPGDDSFLDEGADEDDKEISEIFHENSFMIAYTIVRNTYGVYGYEDVSRKSFYNVLEKFVVRILYREIIDIVISENETELRSNNVSMADITNKIDKMRDRVYLTVIKTIRPKIKSTVSACRDSTASFTLKSKLIQDLLVHRDALLDFERGFIREFFVPLKMVLEPVLVDNYSKYCAAMVKNISGGIYEVYEAVLRDFKSILQTRVLGKMLLDPHSAEEESERVLRDLEDISISSSAKEADKPFYGANRLIYKLMHSIDSTYTKMSRGNDTLFTDGDDDNNRKLDSFDVYVLLTENAKDLLRNAVYSFKVNLMCLGGQTGATSAPVSSGGSNLGERCRSSNSSSLMDEDGEEAFGDEEEFYSTPQAASLPLSSTSADCPRSGAADHVPFSNINSSTSSHQSDQQHLETEKRSSLIYRDTKSVCAQVLTKLSGDIKASLKDIFMSIFALLFERCYQEMIAVLVIDNAKIDEAYLKQLPPELRRYVSTTYFQSALSRVFMNRFIESVAEPYVAEGSERISEALSQLLKKL